MTKSKIASDIRALQESINYLRPFKEGSIVLNERHFYQNSMLFNWTQKQAHPVTLRHLANFGRKMTEDKIVSSANFVRTELPTRLSLKIKELQNLPYKVTNNYHISQVYQSYYDCFNAFRKVPKIETLEQNEEFCQFVTNMLDDHLIVLPHLMMGALEVSILRTMSQNELDEFMSSMLRSRISRRVIMDQHISMSREFMKNKNSVNEEIKPHDYVGEIFQHCSAHENLKLSYRVIENFLQTLYPNLIMPDLVIEGEDIIFQFMTKHLNYIFTEIFRNSMRSTIEHFIKMNIHKQDYENLKPPPIVVSITNTKSEMSFKFSDQGGGIEWDKLDSVWSFGKSPELARKYLSNFHKLPGLNLPTGLPIEEHHYFQRKMNIANPDKLAGVLDNIGQMERSTDSKSVLGSLASRPFEYTLGISLPMCKVYTDYWNGSLNISSMTGYGSDLYLKLQKLGQKLDEKSQLDKA